MTVLKYLKGCIKEESKELYLCNKVRNKYIWKMWNTLNSKSMLQEEMREELF